MEQLMYKLDSKITRLSILDSFRRGRKRSSIYSSNLLKTGSLLNVRGGEQIIVTYTSAADKMRLFSKYILEGLESGDAVWYSYPDEESTTVRAELKKHGVDVEKYEKDGTLYLTSLTEQFMSNGKLDYDKAVIHGLKYWAEMRDKGYKHVRDLEDVGDLSFTKGQWRKWATDYWLDPRWDDPSISEWVLLTEQKVGAVYIPLIMSITAFNVERMEKKQVDEVLEALGRTAMVPRRFFIDLFGDMNCFSSSIGLTHDRLIGRKILMEYDPTSNYENVVDNLKRESMANVEPLFIFTSRTSPLHAQLAEQPAVNFFLTSLSTSNPQPISENKVLLPAKSTSLILDAINNVLETYPYDKICFVFDILTELLTMMGQETLIFLRQVLDMLISEKLTCFFLLNTSAHEPKIVSQIRGLIPNILIYDQNVVKVLKFFGLD